MDSMVDRSENTRPPRHVVIACHPREDSFNLSVARHYIERVRARGHEAELRDLYRMNFDPVLRATEIPTAPDFALAADVLAELDILSRADVLVLVYPIWFGTPPAMIKGYVDRVLGAGFTHGALRGRDPHPLLAGRALVTFSSSSASEAWLDEQGAMRALETIFDDYLRHAFSLGVTEHVHFASVVEGLRERFVNEYLYLTDEVAARICARVERTHVEDTL